MRNRGLFALLILFAANGPTWAADAALVADATVTAAFKARCLSCHASAKREGDLDLEKPLAGGEASIAADAGLWERVLENIASGEMPPQEAPQLSAEERAAIEGWVGKTLDTIATRTAGDPGPVSLRRLSHMEYTYTIRDLTGVESLDPVRDLRAQQQGSTNQAAAQGGMSEALLAKYLDAANEVASHAVLLPDGIRFSASDQRQDWIDEYLSQIRDFYARFAADGSGGKTVQDGVSLTLGDGGRLPVDRYLTALQAGASTRSNPAPAGPTLSQKYLAILRETLEAKTPSPILDPLRAKFRAGTLQAADVAAWQNVLWRFAQVGHIGKVGGPKAWQEPVDPIVTQQEVRLPLVPPKDGGDASVWIVVGDAGDGSQGDVALIENARIVTPGKQDLPLKDLRRLAGQADSKIREFARLAPACLAAVADIETAKTPPSVADLAARHRVPEAVLRPWLDLIPSPTAAGQNGGGTVAQLLAGTVTKKMDGVPQWPALKGWAGEGNLGFLANPTDQGIDVAGTFPARSLIVHPSPQAAAVTVWQSPVATLVRVEGELRDLDLGGGNGVEWSVRIHGEGRWQTLASGVSKGGEPVRFGPFPDLRVAAGDVVALEIAPRDGDHKWDSTFVSLAIADGTRTWDLAKDVAADLLAGNPHADSHGNDKVWHFVGRPLDTPDKRVATGSLLAAWSEAATDAARAELAGRIADLLRNPQSTPADSPDGKLAATLLTIANALPADALGVEAVSDAYGLDPRIFGRAPDGTEVAPTSLCLAAPTVVEFRVPGSMIGKDTAFLTRARLRDPAGDGSVQAAAVTTRPAALAGLLPPVAATGKAAGKWTENQLRTDFNFPILVAPSGTKQKLFETACAEFRSVFPLVLCYPKIVPVDEVVTLMLYYREDDHLRRLMLDDAQKAELDRLWEGLTFVSEAPIEEVVVLEQIIQFATQGADQKIFEPLREPYREKAEAFRRARAAAEPRHVQAIVDLAAKAWRRPLAAAEQDGLQKLYGTLRAEGLEHAAAVRMLLAGVLTSPEFLYRGERPAKGMAAVPVSDQELATRLSYFLWSSLPDDELRAAAAAGKLRDPDVLAAQARRMLADPKVRRLAAEFGCEYLHVGDVATLDEKSETHFPTFKAVRGDMQEEVVRFFTDLFQADRSVLTLLDADHTFVNGPLAQHYALPGIDPKQAEWKRIDGLKARGRGGMLGFAATQARQAGASRTSPILRGNWVWEVVLGQKLPKPPQGVPQLPEETPAGLTERELTQRHSSDARCAGCHRRIDPYGFALEGFDAIGRSRQKDAAGLPIDTATALADGTPLAGLDGLRQHLLGTKRDEVVRQFCRKLLMYALGRPLLISDKPLVEDMVRTLAAHDYKVGMAIDRIVRSPQFREVRGMDYAGVAASATRP
jgi:mono/diheme cytochrome c family protein